MVLEQGGKRSAAGAGSAGRKAIVAAMATSAAMLASQASATTEFNVGSVNLKLSGFTRAEIALDLNGPENPNNQEGNTFNNQTIQREAHAPPRLAGGDWASNPVIMTDIVRRGNDIDSQSNWLNYGVLRTDAELSANFTEDFSFVGRVRALFDPNAYHNFNARDVRHIHRGGAGPDDPGGIIGGEKKLYQGETNLFSHVVAGGSDADPLEISGRKYMVDLPTLVFGYSTGGLNIRVGNQAIAWGQALFFRVMDTPAGLDLRRHLFIDRALEEFGDERISSLGIRVTDQITDAILIDSFFSKFQPNVLPNPGSPYNVVPAQFTIHDRYKQGNYDSKFSYGMRAKAEYGTWGWQAMAVRRWNPDGVFRWTKSGVVRPFMDEDLGATVNALYDGQVLQPHDPSCEVDGNNNSATALANTGLSVEPGGVYTAQEYFYYAADARLDGIKVLNNLIEDVSVCAYNLGASMVDPGSYDQAYAQADTFFMAAGDSLRGHVERRYFQENVFGLGTMYITESETIDFFNQIVLNLEASYTPNRVFTDIGLDKDFKKKDDFQIALIADKWHRFFDEFPGTLLIGQVLFRKESDIAGRLLDGYGGTQDRVPDGRDGATYVVFGGQQPWPNRIYELEFAALIDTAGGLFGQLGLRWNPGRGWHIEGFYNGTTGSLWGSNPNDNLIGTLDFIDEFTLRIGREF